MNQDPKRWSQPFAALLGAYNALVRVATREVRQVSVPVVTWTGSDNRVGGTGAYLRNRPFMS